MTKIAIIIPHFGKLRNDFAFWLISAGYNSTIDFIIITDNMMDEYNVPSNVKIYKSDLGNIEELIKCHVDPICNLNSPYKLCDYRPAYGLIFKDYIENYDFWGHCDTDLILGNIRKFLPDMIFNEYDRILANGHLTFYRNDIKTNNAFKEVKSPNWEKVYTSEKSFCFDEWGGTSKYWNEHNKSKFYINDNMHDDIAPYVYHFFSINKKRQERNCMYSFNKGALYKISCIKEDMVVEETMYVHFQKRTLLIKTKPSESFSIIPNRFINFIEKPTKSYLKWHIRENIIWPLFIRLRNKILRNLNLNIKSFNTHNLVLHN